MCLILFNTFFYLQKCVMKLEKRRFHLMMFTFLEIAYIFGIIEQVYKIKSYKDNKDNPFQSKYWIFMIGFT